MLAVLSFYAVLLALTLVLEPWVQRLGVPVGAVLVLLGFVGSEAWVAIGGDAGLHWRWFDDLIFHLLLPIELPYWWTIQSIAYGVVLWTLLVQAMSMPLVLRWLRP